MTRLLAHQHIAAALLVFGALGCREASSPSSGSSSGGGTGGTDQVGTGGSSSGGSTSGGSAGSNGIDGTPPKLSADFASLDGFSVVTKADLIPGATATIEPHENSSNGSALRLFVPGQADPEPGQYAGPGLHAIEVLATGGTQLYGRYEMRVSFPSCAPGEELVSGLFTYFNDGSDENGNGIADNSEIDIEHLCGEPQFLWMSVWTDYGIVNDEERFVKSTRVIDMRTGNTWDTPLGTNEYGGLASVSPIPGLAIANFPVPGDFYHLGFEWRPGSVRYFLIDGEEEIELWHLEGDNYVPARPAHFLINLWHASSHWFTPGSASFPANDASLFVDWVKIWE